MMKPETLELILAGEAKKGDVIGIARIAGIMAREADARADPALPSADRWRRSASRSRRAGAARPAGDGQLPALTGKTGVEMEALTAVSVACLTIYDMAKAVDRAHGDQRHPRSWQNPAAGPATVDRRSVDEPHAGRGGASPHPRSRTPAPRAEPSAAACATQRAASWPRHLASLRPSRPSTPRPWTAMRSARRTRRRRRSGRCASIGESAAGHAFAGACGPGETIRIFTGAPVPAGADAILIQENAERRTATRLRRRRRSSSASTSARPASISPPGAASDRRHAC